MPGSIGWLPRRARSAVFIASPSRWILPDDFAKGAACGLLYVICRRAGRVFHMIRVRDLVYIGPALQIIPIFWSI